MSGCESAAAGQAAIACLVWLPSCQPGAPRDSMEKYPLFNFTNSKHCLLVLKPSPSGLRSVGQPRTARSKKALLGSWARGLSPVHSANRFTFHSRRKTPSTTALRFRRALIAVVLAKDQAAWFMELGKSGFHALPRFHLAQDPLHLLIKLP